MSLAEFVFFLFTCLVCMNRAQIIIMQPTLTALTLTAPPLHCTVTASILSLHLPFTYCIYPSIAHTPIAFTLTAHTPPLHLPLFHLLTLHLGLHTDVCVYVYYVCMFVYLFIYYSHTYIFHTVLIQQYFTSCTCFNSVTFSHSESRLWYLFCMRCVGNTPLKGVATGVKVWGEVRWGACNLADAKVVLKEVKPTTVVEVCQDRCVCQVRPSKLFSRIMQQEKMSTNKINYADHDVIYLMIDNIIYITPSCLIIPKIYRLRRSLLILRFMLSCAPAVTSDWPSVAYGALCYQSMKRGRSKYS